jgi:fructose-1-phosphate kinase PfkB-like protein
MPGFNDILEGLHDKYFTKCPPKRLFFDFADITMRGTEAMLQTFELLSALTPHVPKTLSMNEHEAALLFSCCGEEMSGDMNAAMESTVRVKEKAGLDELIIHTPYFAVAATQNEAAAARQNYCERPVRTAGAGDSFNGGYIAACCSTLSLKQRLVVANAATRYFIANGLPPERDALVEAIDLMDGQERRRINS